MSKSHIFLDKFSFTLPAVLFICVIFSTSYLKAYTEDTDKDWGLVTMEGFDNYLLENKETLANIKTVSADAEKERKELAKKLERLQRVGTSNQARHNVLVTGKKKDPAEMKSEAEATLKHVQTIVKAKSNAMSQEAFQNMNSLALEE